MVEKDYKHLVGGIKRVSELYPKKWTKNPLVYDRLKKKGYRE